MSCLGHGVLPHRLHGGASARQSLFNLTRRIFWPLHLCDPLSDGAVRLRLVHASVAEWRWRRSQYTSTWLLLPLRPHNHASCCVFSSSFPFPPPFPTTPSVPPFLCCSGMHDSLLPIATVCVPFSFTVCPLFQMTSLPQSLHRFACFFSCLCLCVRGRKEEGQQHHLPLLPSTTALFGFFFVSFRASPPSLQLNSQVFFLCRVLSTAVSSFSRSTNARGGGAACFCDGVCLSVCVCVWASPLHPTSLRPLVTRWEAGLLHLVPLHVVSVLFFSVSTFMYFSKATHAVFVLLTFSLPLCRGASCVSPTMSPSVRRSPIREVVLLQRKSNAPCFFSLHWSCTELGKRVFMSLSLSLHPFFSSLLAPVEAACGMAVSCCTLFMRQPRAPRDRTR